MILPNGLKKLLFLFRHEKCGRPVRFRDRYRRMVYLHDILYTGTRYKGKWCWYEGQWGAIVYEGVLRLTEAREDEFLETRIWSVQRMAGPL